MRMARAQENGLFDSEIVPIHTEVVKPDGNKEKVVISKDDGIRKGTSMQGLAKLRPAFNPQGGTTAGNSSQTTDGGAVVLLARIPLFWGLRTPLFGSATAGSPAR